MVPVLAEGPGTTPFAILGMTPGAFLQHLPIGFLVHNGVRLLHISDQALVLAGYGRGEVEDGPFLRLVHPDFVNRALDVDSHPLSLRQELQLRRKDESRTWVEYTGYKVAGSGTSLVLAFLTGIDSWKTREMELAATGTRDPLTGVGSRQLLIEELGRLLQARGESLDPLAILFIDLDRLKLVNDSLGHEAGDRTLAAIAGRMRDALPPSALLTRHGGDEFIVLLREVQGPDYLEKVARKLLDCILVPLDIDGTEICLSASAGYAVFPGDGMTVEELLKNADRAMYRAKRSGGSTVHFHQWEAPASDATLRLNLERRLRESLASGSFLLHYQPRIAATTGRVKAIEALVRWAEPGQPLVLPGEFISVCEETGLIHELGRKILGLVATQLRILEAAGHGSVCMAVNLSPRQFLQPRLFTEIQQTLLDQGVAPERLEFEITESAMLQNPDEAIRIMTRWRAHGIRVALDDFGRGFSSMERLRQLPFSHIKIDRLFVESLLEDPTNLAIIQAVILIAKSLGIQTVAEGVETEEVAEALRALGCDELQGFLIARPMSGEDIVAYLDRAGT